ncbi:MAG: DNA polymerase III subunit gamma/tau [Candidatus Moraniibacteriota bacterium]
MSLYRKYRPKKFSEITGQQHIVKTLAGSIANNRVGHAYLFTGSRGIGKTTLARIFAKTLNCLDPQKGKEVSIEPCGKCQNCKSISEGKTIDLIEIDAASHTGVDNIRQLKENINLPPSFLKKKVYIIDEVHMLSTGAFNALLKTLEEPPEHSIFILATTELHKVPETIISRCQRFDFHRFDQDQITKRLKKLAVKEKVDIDKEALEAIALEAEGGMRDAESLLGQIISLEDKKITAQEVNQILGISSQKRVIDFIEKILSGKTGQALKIIESIQEEGYDLKNFNKNALSVLRTIMISKINPEIGKKESAMTTENYQSLEKITSSVSSQNILFAINVFSESLSKSKETPIPQLPLEMAIMELHLQLNGKSEFPAASKNSDPQKTSAPTASPTSNKMSQEDQTPKKNSTQSIKEKTPDYQVATKVTTKAATKETIASKKQTPKPQKEESGVAQEKTEESSRANYNQDNSQVLKSVLENWNQIQEAVKPTNHSIHACLKNCIPMGVKNEEFYIKTKYSFYKDRLSEAKNKLTISQAIAKITGYKIKVKIVNEQEAEKLNLENTNQENPEDRNVLHEAMQIMGGKIVE